MVDDRIKKLRVSKEYLATHIANKKKKIKKVVSGNKLDRGANKREKILKSLADDDYDSDYSDETSLNQEDLPKVNKKRKSDTLDGESVDETILARRYNNKKSRWEWETHNEDEILWEPKESFIDEHGEEMEEFREFEDSHPYEDEDTNPGEGLLTQGSMHIFNHTRKLASAQVTLHIIEIFLKQQISSADIKSPQDMLDVSREIKAMSKKETRSSRIAEKEKEKNELANNLKKHQEEQTNSQNFSTLIQLQGLKLLKSFMDEDSGEDKVITELKESYQELNNKHESLETKVVEIQSSLAEIISLLKK